MVRNAQYEEEEIMLRWEGGGWGRLSERECVGISSVCVCVRKRVCVVATCSYLTACISTLQLRHSHTPLQPACQKCSPGPNAQP